MAVAHGKDAVVQLCAAGDGGEDARLVELEDRPVGLDGHRHWLLRNRRLKGRLVLGGHVLEAGDGHGGLAATLLRRALGGTARARGVGVVLLGAHAVLLHEAEGVVHEATPATVLGAVARDELLFRERYEVARGHTVGTLDGADGRERPARAARSLVLYRRHAPLLDPVHVLWQTIILTHLGCANHDALLAWRALLEAAQVQGGELFPRHVRVEVVAQLE
mmetsp:Transcript_22996/g.62417  ORF Transcript_22996/g.62417 Transcript_22996/m.62417 type:complete len:220 (+) Transcript_22996:1366-2025(+)